MTEPRPRKSEWNQPAIRFGTEDDRSRFQQMLIDARDHYWRASGDVPPDVVDTLQTLVHTLESMIDKMGQEMDTTGRYVFETPAELNAALAAVNYVHQVIEHGDLDPTEKETALQNIAEIAAKLEEVHWDNKPLGAL